MFKFIELFIGIVVIINVARYIIRGYSASNVLFVGGLTLLIISMIIDHHAIPIIGNSTSYSITGIVRHIKILLTSPSSDLVIIIMILCGFSSYMTHIGANYVIVKLAYKLLQHINSRYILMISVYFVACLMSLAIPSATGLGILLMTTLFLVMINTGISRGAAAAICTSPTAIILSPASGDLVLAAKTTKIPLIDFTFKTILPISVFAIIGIAIAHYFWQKFLDKKEKNISYEVLDITEVDNTTPVFYVILPFTPIIGISIFNGKCGTQLYITTILIICMLLSVFLEFIRGFSIQNLFNGLKVVYRSMKEAFSNVVMLLVAASVFAKGLNTIGFIQNLISIVTSFSSASIVLMLSLAILTVVIAITTGSGNAPFYTFIEIIPKLAYFSDTNLIYLSIPMLQASNLGRTISPVSGVVVIIAKMAKISPFEVVKRTSVPILFGLIIVIITTEILIPSTA